MADPGPKSSLTAWVWVLVACVAIFELVAHPVIRAGVPSGDSWEDATGFVRERFEPNDRIIAAPRWVDPIVRSYLGDLSSPALASATDFAGVDRVWEVGVRGATHRSEPPLLEEFFGGVHVRMWQVRSDEVLFDFVEDGLDYGEPSYADVEAGQLVALLGSGGQLEVAVANGSAAAVLSAQIGDAVVVSPGSFFGPGNEQFMRFALVPNLADCEAALERMAAL